MKFIRCFAHGLTPGATIETIIAGQSVTASYEAPQFDVVIESEDTTPATSEAEASAAAPAESSETGSTPTE